MIPVNYFPMRNFVEILLWEHVHQIKGGRSSFSIGLTYVDGHPE